MAATTRVDLSNVRILDLEASKRALDSVADPKAKFQILDDLTDKELMPSFVFQMITTVGNDPAFAEYARPDDFTMGLSSSVCVNRILETVEKSKQLSEYAMISIGESGKNQLSSVCHNVNTYIHIKLFHALHRITSAPNFLLYISKPTHPLNPIHKKMWELQEYNHGATCPCFKHIETHLAANVQNPPGKTTTCITVRYDAGLGNKLYIRGQGGGLSWEKGIELKNTGGDTWVYETQDDFANLEYKILLNNNGWEKDANHKIERGKRVEFTPNF